MKVQGHIVVRRRANNGNDGKPGDKGKDGLQGCILRQSEWVAGVEYRNDEALTSGTRYLDIAIVTTGANTFNAYKCLKTHTSSDSIPVTNTTYWQKFNSLVPIYTPLIMAQNAILRFMQGNQLLIMKSDNKTVAAGLVGGDYPLWVGGTSPASAPFKVSITGRLIGTDVELTGIINAESGKVGGFTIDSGRLYWKARDYFGSDSRSLKLGVSQTDMEGIVDVSFNAATQGRFGIKAVGSNLGGAAIYASSKSSGQSYPISANTYAGYFDGGVHVNGNVYCGIILANEIGTSWGLGNNGTYSYTKGLTKDVSMLGGIEMRFVNGLLVQYG